MNFAVIDVTLPHDLHMTTNDRYVRDRCEMGFTRGFRWPPHLMLCVRLCMECELAHVIEAVCQRQAPGDVDTIRLSR